jgi:hypothetical protein
MIPDAIVGITLRPCVMVTIVGFPLHDIRTLPVLEVKEEIDRVVIHSNV